MKACLCARGKDLNAQLQVENSIFPKFGRSRGSEKLTSFAKKNLQHSKNNSNVNNNNNNGLAEHAEVNSAGGGGMRESEAIVIATAARQDKKNINFSSICVVKANNASSATASPGGGTVTTSNECDTNNQQQRTEGQRTQILHTDLWNILFVSKWSEEVLWSFSYIFWQNITKTDVCKNSVAVREYFRSKRRIVQKILTCYSLSQQHKAWVVVKEMRMKMKMRKRCASKTQRRRRRREEGKKALAKMWMEMLFYLSNLSVACYLLKRNEEKKLTLMAERARAQPPSTMHKHSSRQRANFDDK